MGMHNSSNKIESSASKGYPKIEPAPFEATQYELSDDLESEPKRRKMVVLPVHYLLLDQARAIFASYQGIFW